METILGPLIVLLFFAILARIMVGAISKQKRSRQGHHQYQRSNLTPQVGTIQSAQTPTVALPYKKKDALLTHTEKHFFEALRQIAYKNNLLVFAKVRMEDLIRVPNDTDNQWGWRNRIKSRHVDFVLCDPESARPLVAIELDDPSHYRYDRMERDAMVDRIFKGAGLPLLHVRAAYKYDPLTLENQIRASAGNVI